MKTKTKTIDTVAALKDAENLLLHLTSDAPNSPETKATLDGLGEAIERVEGMVELLKYQKRMGVGVSK